MITDTFRATDLVAESLRTISLAMVTSPDHPLASRSSVNAYDLKHEPLLIPTTDCSYIQLLEKILTEEKVELVTVLRFNCTEAIKKGVMTGLGLAVLPQIAVAEELAEGWLVELPWANGPLVADLWMIWQKNKWIEVFMAITRETLAA